MFCVHGGLSPNLTDLKQVYLIQRPCRGDGLRTDRLHPLSSACSSGEVITLSFDLHPTLTGVQRHDKRTTTRRLTNLGRACFSVCRCKPAPALRHDVVGPRQQRARPHQVQAEPAVCRSILVLPPPPSLPSLTPPPPFPPPALPLRLVWLRREHIVML